MLVKLYQGNTSASLGNFDNVTTLTINKDGSFSLTRELSNPAGKEIKSFGPHANKIEVIRAYDE